MRYKIYPDRFQKRKIKLKSEITKRDEYSKSQVETKFLCQEKWVWSRNLIKILIDISEMKIY